MSSYPNIFKRGPWLPWFAWFPVRTPQGWRFGTTIERRCVFCAGAGFAATVGHEYHAA